MYDVARIDAAVDAPKRPPERKRPRPLQAPADPDTAEGAETVDDPAPHIDLRA